MSIWQTPKEDWKLDDTPILTDLDRIEGNCNFLKNTYQITGYDFQSNIHINSDGYFNIAKICINVPSGFTIKILRFSHHASDSYIRFRVWLFDGTNPSSSWNTTSASNEENPDFVLYSNTTANTVTTTIAVEYRTSEYTGGDYTNLTVGCLLFLSKETTV